MVPRSGLLLLVGILLYAQNLPGKVLKPLPTEDIPIGQAIYDLEKRAENAADQSGAMDHLPVTMKLAELHILASLKRKTVRATRDAKGIWPVEGPASFEAKVDKNADSENHLRKALKLFRKVYVKYGKNPPSIIQLEIAWCLEGLGEVAKARVEYRTFLKEFLEKKNGNWMECGRDFFKEGATSLIRLLDPLKDVAEIEQVKEQMAKDHSLECVFS